MLKKIIVLFLAAAIAYGCGRAYYAITGGFTVSNITSDLSYDPKWETPSLSPEEKQEVQHILNQEFAYLGKGCQAYVFASKDGDYVIKFFKYQRFRPQAWIDLFTFIPFVKSYQDAKVIEKKQKLDKVFISWKIAYENLKNETGVIYIHLNKGGELQQPLSIIDKMGFQNTIDLSQTEYMIQKRAVMLCPAIDQLMINGQSNEASLLIDRLLTMLLLEYGMGYADNDHALIQNTGVLDGFPIHIDVGQFIRNDSVKAPKVYKQELYDKTFKFYLWLNDHYPSLADHLKTRLVVIIGPDYFYSAPYVHKGDVAKIPHVVYSEKNI
ncbi:MAG: hypothetical protein WCF65_07670 [Parachlamydiaceae bacterium]